MKFFFFFWFCLRLLFFFFYTCVTIGAFPDGKDGSQLLSTHWLQLQQPFPLLVGRGLTVFQYLELRRGGVVA